MRPKQIIAILVAAFIASLLFLQFLNIGSWSSFFSSAKVDLAVPYRESLLAELNTAKDNAKLAQADMLISAEWSAAEALYVQTVSAAPELARPEFEKLCSQATQAFNNCSVNAIGYVEFQKASNAYRELQLVHRRGAPDRVTADTKIRILGCERNAEEAVSKSRYAVAASKYREATEYLKTADHESRAQQVNHLLEVGERRKAFGMLYPIAGQADAAPQLNALFDELASESPAWWLDRATELLADLKEFNTREFDQIRLPTARSLAKAYGQLGMNAQLEALLEECLRLMPEANSPRLSGYVEFVGAGLRSVARRDLEERLIADLARMDDLPTEILPLTFLILNRAQDFEKSMNRLIDSSEQPVKALASLFASAASQTRDFSALDELLDRFRSEFKESEILHFDALKAELGSHKLLIDPETIDENSTAFTQSDCKHLLKLAFHTRNSSYLRAMSTVMRKKSSDASQSGTLQKDESATLQYMAIVANPSPTNILDGLHARCAQLEVDWPDSAASKFLAEQVLQNRNVKLHEVNAMLEFASPQVCVDILSALATANVKSTKAPTNKSDLIKKRFTGSVANGDEKNERTNLDFIFRPGRSGNEIEAWLYSTSKDEWHLAHCHLDSDTLTVKPSDVYSGDSKLLSGQLLLHLSDSCLMGLEFRDSDGLTSCALANPIELDDRDIEEFAEATSFTAFLKLLERDPKGQITKWHRPPILVFKSDFPLTFKGEGDDETSGRASHFGSVQTVAKAIAQEVEGFDARVVRDTSRVNFMRNPTLSFYFAPKNKHKHVALSAGFQEDPLATEEYAVFAKHPSNVNGQLQMVLVCIDPSDFSEDQLASVVEGCMLRALGVGVSARPITNIYSVLNANHFKSSRTGMTDLDKRMLRAVYALRNDAEIKFVREAFRASSQPN